jgi:trk system potassium uptake protein
LLCPSRFWQYRLLLQPEKSMRVIIVGAGEVGFHTAQRLALEGQEVVLLDTDRQRLRQVEEQLDVLALLGSGARAEDLEEAGIRSCELFIAVTDMDEVNLIACLLAREYGVATKIARVKSMGYKTSHAVLNARKLGIDLFINPVEAVANDLAAIARQASAVEVAEFADGRILFVGYTIEEGNPVCGLSLTEFQDIREMYPFVVVGITRAGRALIPRGEDAIAAGDHVFVVLRAFDLANVRYLLGFEKRNVRKAFILGGGAVGRRLVEHLEADGIDVRVVDPDRSVCEELAQQLQRAVVLHAEIIDVDALVAEGLDKADVVVAVSEAEETNILACLLAKRRGARRALCMVNRPAYVSLVPSLGIDACISPRLSTASAILRRVRPSGLVNLAMVEENQAEVLELAVTKGLEWLGKPLNAVGFPPGAIAGAVVRGTEALIPTGETILQPGDRAIVFALHEAVLAVERFFAVR